VTFAQQRQRIVRIDGVGDVVVTGCQIIAALDQQLLSLAKMLV